MTRRPSRSACCSASSQSREGTPVPRGAGKPRQAGPACGRWALAAGQPHRASRTPQRSRAPAVESEDPQPPSETLPPPPRASAFPSCKIGLLPSMENLDFSFDVHIA
ncbi:uncharacterized protein LOC144457014 [Phascolarctos cinereus]